MPMKNIAMDALQKLVKELNSASSLSSEAAEQLIKETINDAFAQAYKETRELLATQQIKQDKRVAMKETRGELFKAFSRYIHTDQLGRYDLEAVNNQEPEAVLRYTLETVLRNYNLERVPFDHLNTINSEEERGFQALWDALGNSDVKATYKSMFKEMASNLKDEIRYNFSPLLLAKLVLTAALALTLLPIIALMVIATVSILIGSGINKLAEFIYGKNPDRSKSSTTIAHMLSSIFKRPFPGGLKNVLSFVGRVVGLLAAPLFIATDIVLGAVSIAIGVGAVIMTLASIPTLIFFGLSLNSLSVFAFSVDWASAMDAPLSKPRLMIEYNQSASTLSRLGHRVERQIEVPRDNNVIYLPGANEQQLVDDEQSVLEDQSDNSADSYTDESDTAHSLSFTTN